MSDETFGGETAAADPADESSDGADKATEMVARGASMGRQHMALVIPVLLPIAGLLAFFGALYISFEFLTNDYIDVVDVIIGSFGIVTATFVYTIALAIHGFHIFKGAQQRRGVDRPSTGILKSIAGALRGNGEAFLIAILVAIPFLALQAIIADGNVPIPFFGAGLIGLVVSPVIYGVTTLIFSYLAAEFLETLVGIREEKRV